MSSDWHGLALGALGEFRNGVNFSREQEGHGLPVLKVKDFASSYFVPSEGLDELDSRAIRVPDSQMLAPGDVVVIRSNGNPSLVGRCLYVAKLQRPTTFSGFCIRFRPNPERVNPRFASYLLRAPASRARFYSFGSGTGIQNLSQSVLSELPVLLPPRTYQDSITDLLAGLDDKIDLNRRMNRTLEAMAQALFRSWFVDFDPVRAKAEGRQPEGMDAETAALFPSRLVDSELGEIPEAWQIASLGGLLDEIETGSRPKGGVAGIVEGVPSVGAESVTRIGEYDYSKEKRVPRAFFEGMRKGKLRSWDVLLYKDGGRPGEFEPKASLVGEGFPFEEMAINEHVYRLRADHHLTQSFLYLLLSSETVKEELRRRGTGVAVPGLNSTALRTMPVLRPTGPVLRAFDSTASVLLRKILVTSKESRHLATVRDLLLPKLLSGEIRVGDAEVQLAASA